MNKSKNSGVKGNRSPRWAKWGLMPQIEIWQAIALSLQIEPSEVRLHPFGWMDDIPPFDESEEFNDRLDILKAHVLGNSYPKVRTLRLDDEWYKSQILMSEFSHWASTIVKFHQLPDQLLCLAKPSMPPEIIIRTENRTDNPWLIKDTRDGEPEGFQSWYTPARFFARSCVRDDPTLLSKREVLAHKVSQLLANAGFKKRGGKLNLSPATVKKAFVNIDLT